MNKQEVEAKADELLGQYDALDADGSSCYYGQNVISAMTEMALWMQQNQSGMRWIRASERDIPSYQTIARFVHTKAILMNAQSFLTLMPDQKPLIEWLDESASSEVERLRKENEELLEMLKRASATLISPKWREDYNSLLQKVEQK